MHMHYRVSLPGHDWMVTSGHKLIPSVYAALNVGQNDVEYSNPTFITIRISKHDKSTAATHSADFMTMEKLAEFQEFMKNEEAVVKPVVLIMVDGGADENPRYAKTLCAAIGHFKRYGLDALFITCHAPGQSAYNAVERRMAPLSHDVAGLILPHNHFGDHLDGHGRTTDAKLEKLNFSKAGEILAEVWSQTIIDGHPVVAKYIDPDSSTPDLDLSYCEQWKAIHVRQSQYCLQVVKCRDLKCCGRFRSSFLHIFPDRFLPPPIRYLWSRSGPAPATVESEEGRFGSLGQRFLLKSLDPTTNYSILPFDFYCPSLQDKLVKRVCNHCGLYFITATALTSHRKLHKSLPTTTIDFVDEEEEAVEDKSDGSGIFIIKILKNWLNYE